MKILMLILLFASSTSFAQGSMCEFGSETSFNCIDGLDNDGSGVPDDCTQTATIIDNGCDIRNLTTDIDGNAVFNLELSVIIGSDSAYDGGSCIENFTLNGDPMPLSGIQTNCGSFPPSCNKNGVVNTNMSPPFEISGEFSCVGTSTNSNQTIPPPPPIFGISDTLSCSADFDDSETICDDGLDNDGDGDIDMADEDCLPPILMFTRGPTATFNGKTQTSCIWNLDFETNVPAVCRLILPLTLISNGNIVESNNIAGTPFGIPFLTFDVTIPATIRVECDNGALVGTFDIPRYDGQNL